MSKFKIGQNVILKPNAYEQDYNMKLWCSELNGKIGKITKIYDDGWNDAKVNFGKYHDRSINMDYLDFA